MCWECGTTKATQDLWKWLMPIDLECVVGQVRGCGKWAIIQQNAVTKKIDFGGVHS